MYSTFISILIMISNDLENINALPEILFRNTKNFPTKNFYLKKIKKVGLGKTTVKLVKMFLY